MYSIRWSVCVLDLSENYPFPFFKKYHVMYAYLTKEMYNHNYFIVKILTKDFPFLLNWVWKFIWPWSKCIVGFVKVGSGPGNQYQLPISLNFEKGVDLLLFYILCKTGLICITHIIWFIFKTSGLIKFRCIL